MNTRSIITTATIALAAAALAVGCGNKGGSAGGASSTKPTSKPAAKPSAAKSAAKPATAAAAFGKGVITGSVALTGEKAPEMKVPAKRKDHEVCKDEEIVYNAVLVKDGKLKDVFVGIASGQLKGEYEAKGSVTVDQKGCMYSPRMSGLMVEQELQITNSDATMHNVNAKQGADLKFNFAQPKGAPAQKKSFDEAGTYRFQCDVHPWMRAFAIVSDNPFYAVSGEDGSFKIEKVPDGKYKVMAWHSQYGKKEQEVEVKGGEVKVEFKYDGTEAEPDDNKGELNGLW